MGNAFLGTIFAGYTINKAKELLSLKNRGLRRIHIKLLDKNYNTKRRLSSGGFRKGRKTLSEGEIKAFCDIFSKGNKR